MAFAHVAKDERQKLDSKAIKCIFLGYGTETKGYRLYNLKRATVVYSRDVYFNELKIIVEKESETSEKQVMQLDGDSDEEVVEEPVVDNNYQRVVRRSACERRPPNLYGDWVNLAHEDREPTSASEAMTSSDKAKWQSAMEMEMESLRGNEVWNLVKLPENRKTVGSKWVFKVKVGPDGSIERHKARLVVQGYSQKYGLDYDETFSPVVRTESVRTVIVLAKNNLLLQQMDVTTAFLNGILEEEVYMKQPEGFVEKGKEHLVCKLNKNIYGLKHSPRCWMQFLMTTCVKLGFVNQQVTPASTRQKERRS